MKICSQSADTVAAAFVEPSASGSLRRRYSDDPHISKKHAPPIEHGMVYALIAISLDLFGCVNTGQVDSEVTKDLPGFVGSNRNPSGKGVDLCLHSSAVRRNPRANPNLAWDDESCFTIMGHGLTESKHGPILLDERLDKILNITPSRLSDIVKEDPVLRMKLSRANYVLMYSCNSGSKTAEGMPSYASQLADKLNKPVIAPTEKLTMHGGSGVISHNGVYKVSYPRQPF